MNTVKTCSITSPYDKTETCAQLTIDDTTSCFVMPDVMVAGDEYTISMWVRSNAAGEFSIGDNTIVSSSSWNRCEITFTTTSEDLAIYFKSTGVYYIYHFQVEAGNKATDWSPAPEDVESEVLSLENRMVSAETKIIQNSEQILLRAVKSEVDETFTNYYTKNETYSKSETYSKAEIDITTEGITQTVSKVSTAASNAQSAAEGAQSTADTAVSNAATAQSAAEGAQSTADTAVSNAATAQAAAEGAQAAADKAQEDVDALVIRMESAETKITQNSEQIELRATKETVEIVQKEAAAAQETADTAVSNAATAQAAAEGAQSTADTAVSNAATAQSTADTAVSNAATAQAAAEGAQGDVDALEIRMVSAESTITQHSDSIEMRVTKEEFKSLKIGAKNLVRNSKTLIFGEYAFDGYRLNTPAISLVEE